MTTNESYVKLTMNSDGKVQPELFISGEFDILATIEKFNKLVAEVKKHYVIPENEATYEIKQMSGWKQVTVRGSDPKQVVDKFNELSNSSEVVQ